MDQFKFLILKKKIQQSDLLIKIITDSMTPLINVGDTVELKQLSQKLKPFDIIVFLGAEQKLICHFVLKVFDNGDVITTNLKKLNQRDPAISTNVILGVVKNYKISRYYKIKTFLTFFFS